MIKNEKELEEQLSKPGSRTIDYLRTLEGDFIFLGIAGKIGPSLARMVIRANKVAKVKKRVIGVSRFSNEKERAQLEKSGIETIAGDLLDRNFLGQLPRVKNVIFLAGMKFGSEENHALTWAINSYLPGLVAEHFADSRIVVFSTGCVYPLVPIESGGSNEGDMPLPVGEYAQSCLGRERLFEYGSRRNKTATVLIRLNYATELRYGILVDIALKVKNRIPIDLRMGYFNTIWQGDANNIVLQSLAMAQSPPEILNVTGDETLAVRDVALEFGRRMNIQPEFTGKESDTALLSNATKMLQLFEKPGVTTEKMLDWITFWLMQEHEILNKPTKYEIRDGKY